MSEFAALEAIYDFYDQFTRGFSMACQKGCNVCCTTNVTVTSLEARYLFQSGKLDGSRMKDLEAERQKEHFIPSTTINTTAAMCLAQKPIPEETSPLTFNRCPLLDKEGLCSVYEHRPFACRAMSSETVCTEGGQADMPSFLVTVNLALYQVLEHLDAEGWYGNLLDLIPIAALQEKDQAARLVAAEKGRIKTNRQLPGFIVPPDDTIRFRSFLRRLSKEQAGEHALGELLPEEYKILS